MTVTKDQEMRDLLVRLDESVKLGFQHINAKLDEMNRRADGHETRIRSLEDWRTEVKGGTKGILSMGKIGWSVIGAVIGIVGALGFQFAIVAKDAPSTPQSQTQAQ